MEGVVLGRPWAESVLRRLDFVRRKATKAAKKVPDNFAEIRQRFAARVANAVKEHSIPPELVINMDETGLPIVPVSDWSLDEKGTKQVPLTGLDDKRQITAVLACTATGRLLSPQLLYQGTTTRCHPKATFPETWDVWHSESHRSTHETVKRMVGTILLPYVEATKGGAWPAVFSKCSLDH